MALSGSFTKYFQGNASRFHMTTSWSATQNIANNTSTITAITTVRPEGAIGSTASKNGSITIAGNRKNFTFVLGSLGAGVTKEVGRHTVTVSHASNGTGSAAIASTLDIIITYSGQSLGSLSTSGTATLNTIPRASSFTLGGSTVTDASVTVTITKAATAFRHRVRWRIGSGAWTTTATEADTSSSFKVPHSAFPNGPGGTITVAVQTYSGIGGTAIGSEQTGTRALTVPISVVPSFTTVTHSEYVSAIKTAIGEYVQNKTRLTLAITGASAGNGASIKSYKITVDGQTSAAQSGTTEVIRSSGTLNIVGTVTDSRGRSASKTVEITVLPYHEPTWESIGLTRATSAGVQDPFGTYARLNIKARVASLNGKNNAQYRVRSRVASSSTWSEKTNGASIGISESKSHTYSGYTVTNEYQFEVLIVDKISSQVIMNDLLFLSTGGVPFFVGYDGIASSFGKIPTHNSNYDLEIGDKGLITDGPIVGKEGQEVSYDSTYIIDTRDTNQPPSWYYTNYPRRSLTEFKDASVIGLSNAQPKYVSLHTIVRWTEVSGSGISQIVYGNNNEVYFRTSGNTTSWLAWEQLSTNKKGAVSWANNASTATTISTANNQEGSLQRVSFLSTQTITVSSNNATVIVQGSMVGQISGTTLTVRVKLGNRISTARAVTDRNVPHTLNVNQVFTGVSKGDHTVELLWGTQTSAAIGTIPAFTSATILAWEL